MRNMVLNELQAEKYQHTSVLLSALQLETLMSLELRQMRVFFSVHMLSNTPLQINWQQCGRWLSASSETNLRGSSYRKHL